MELYGIKGLGTLEALNIQKGEKPGLAKKKKWPRWMLLTLGLIKEPMILLLLLAAGFYLSNGQWQDAAFLSLSVIIVASISLYQDVKSQTALDSLKDLTTPKCKTVRDGIVLELFTEELVRGDVVIIEEGNLIPADGLILHANDLSVNESVLTGESFPVLKSQVEGNVYQGTAVTGGLGIVEVTATGENTRLNRIGNEIDQIEVEKTPLEQQINHFVQTMAIAGGIVLFSVWILNYLNSLDLRKSLLDALTLAMSIIPEEIPVAFTTFMAMGAWKLMKSGVLLTDIKAVEALGSASVICLDKTGTITENKMSLAQIWPSDSRKIISAEDALGSNEISLIETAMWASEPIPFDYMEKAIHEAYTRVCGVDRRSEFHMVHEYPLSGKPPMMTHVFEHKNGQRIIACKGAPEAVLAVSGKQHDPEVLKAIDRMTSKGYRVLGVAEALDTLAPFPKEQQQISFNFKGLISFYDPPKTNIPDVLRSFYKAGIKVKIITGDGSLTAISIARQIGFLGSDQVIEGEKVMKLTSVQLQETVQSANLFTRMFPEAKLKVINALKACGEVVVMTGDGVNDGPALKAAHIGVSMGKRGTEIAKGAAKLILLKDDLQGMVDAIALNRKIYNNLKKAIRYIISIHIPIIFVVFVPLVFNWSQPSLFSPIHVIFLELVMGPTCSLVYENEPMEENVMHEKPRHFTSTFFNVQELLVSLIQGVVIAGVTLLLYKYAIERNYDVKILRSMVFTTIIAANIMLTLVNRSFYYSLFKTIRYKNNLITLIVLVTVVLVLALLYFDPFSKIFGFTKIELPLLMMSVLSGSLSVIWFELFKWYHRIQIMKH
jgi:Ca2+-transporting ATPase